MNEPIRKSERAPAGSLAIGSEPAVLHARIAQLEAQLAEQRQRVNELQEREARYHETFDQAAVGIAHVSLEGRFLYVNERVSRMLGYTADEIMGMTFFQLTHPDDAPQTRTNHQEMTSKNVGVISVEKRYLHKDGHPVWIHLVATLVYDSKTNERYYLSILDDISTRKRADEFKRAMEAAQAADKAKGRFLANMSHEIRTPIHGISAMTEYLLEGELADEQRECLDAIKSSTNALLGIINSILDLSKLDANKIELERVSLLPRELMSDTLKPLEFQARAKGIQLQCEVDSEVPRRVYGDPDRLRQVLLNLVGNAIKFTERGGVRVRLAVVEDNPEDVLLEFEVVDTGVGIPPERQQKIFAPFEQADGSTTRVYGGTGLGLTISARLAEQMGGRIDVDSEQGVGSTFRFSARLARARHESRESEPPPRPSPAPKVPRTKREPATQPLRILLVEDNTINRQATARILRRRAHEVELAENGKRAVELLEGSSFDLVLMDVQMPVMDGLTATRLLRHRERGTGRRALVVGLTACAMDGDAQRCLSAGMDDYLSKPYSLAELYAKIEQHSG